MTRSPLLLLLALLLSVAVCATSLASAMSLPYLSRQSLELGLRPVAEHKEAAPRSRLLNADRPAHAECRGQDASQWCFSLTVANRGLTEVVLSDTRASPLEGFVSRGNAFRVVDLDSGAEVRYDGIKMKRALEPEHAVPLTIAAGEQVHVDVDLSDSYAFVEGRRYSVQVRAAAVGDAEVTRVAPSAAAGARSLEFVARATSVQPHVKAMQRRERAGRRPAEPQRAGPHTAATVTGCSGDDQVSAAIANCKAGLDTAYDEYLIAEKCSGDDYVEWFGEPAGARYNEVVLTLKNSVEFFDDDDYIVECGADQCSAGVFAYVYPSDSSHRIHLCDAYRSAPVTLQYNSKPGTLLHEATHFNDVGGTDDHVYGDDSARSLANTDPARAVNNADTFEFFMEFVPDASDNCDNCVSSGESTCGGCTGFATLCGFCNATNQCSRGDLCGSFAYDCADGQWLDDTDCVNKEAPSACTQTSSSSEPVGEISAGVIGAAVVIGVIVLCVMHRRKKRIQAGH